MEYELVCGDYEQDVVSKVRELMHQGWVPLGGIAIRNSLALGDIYFYQAMTRQPRALSWALRLT